MLGVILLKAELLGVILSKIELLGVILLKIELLNRYGFCEVSRLIHITTARERSMVREKLQVRQHRENIENVLFIRHVRQLCVRLHSVNGRENISRRSSCLDLSEIHHGFVGEFAVGYDRDDRSSVFDERYRTVLKLPCGVCFTVEV